jgi:hypothetical protein
MATPVAFLSFLRNKQSGSVTRGVLSQYSSHNHRLLNVRKLKLLALAADRRRITGKPEVIPQGRRWPEVLLAEVSSSSMRFSTRSPRCPVVDSLRRWRLPKLGDPDEDFGQLRWSGDVRTMASLELNRLDAQLRFRDFARPRGLDRAVFRANDVGGRCLWPVR